jgi:ABC-type Na+ efflux pump permease subunit
MRDLIVHDWPLIPWGIWLIALAYAAAYTALLLLLSWLAFRRKALQ